MEKIKMNVEMEVTIPQALALQAMFDHINQLSNIGSSRRVGFYCDGDGNFHPKCKLSFNKRIPKLTDELRKLAVVDDDYGDLVFDFDQIAWKINH